MSGDVTAGTAGDGFRAANQPHRFTPDTPDIGERVHCRICGREQHQCGRDHA